MENKTREELLQEYQLGGISLREMEKKYGIPHTTLHRHVQSYQVDSTLESFEDKSLKSTINKEQQKEQNRERSRMAQQLIEAEQKIALLEELIATAQKEQGLIISKKAITELSALSGKNVVST
jgi:transposase